VFTVGCGDSAYSLDALLHNIRQKGVLNIKKFYNLRERSNIIRRFRGEGVYSNRQSAVIWGRRFGQIVM